MREGHQYVVGYLGTSAFKLCDSADILLTQLNNRTDIRIADLSKRVVFLSVKPKTLG